MTRQHVVTTKLSKIKRSVPEARSEHPILEILDTRTNRRKTAMRDLIMK